MTWHLLRKHMSYSGKARKLLAVGVAQVECDCATGAGGAHWNASVGHTACHAARRWPGMSSMLLDGSLHSPSLPGGAATSIPAPPPPPVHFRRLPPTYPPSRPREYRTIYPLTTRNVRGSMVGGGAHRSGR